jgi:trimethylamine:corrinoid methyltransferase-like protein
VHFPAHWHDTGFSGVLPKGTPIAQCLPVKRESWTAQIDTLSESEVQRVHELSTAVLRDTGIYRRQFRAAKR